MSHVEQKRRVKEFVRRWQNEPGNEEEQSRSFWIQLLEEVLGVQNATHILQFERKVHGRKIDVFYEDMGILIEQKGRGISLDEATIRSKKAGLETPYQQALWYANSLPFSIRPRWIITCNFDEIRIYDQDQEDVGHYETVLLENLPEESYRLSFFTDKKHSRIEQEKQLSVKAGEIVGELYSQLSSQYKNIETDKHEQFSLNVLIVRLVFLLYAEDAELFKKDAFLHYMKKFESSQMRGALISLFEVLNTPINKRDPYLSEELLAFPYVNGDLYSNKMDIVIPQFTEEIRLNLLLKASQKFNWKKISPTIFGAVFESTLNPETRRAGGMHYTSIENIHKVIDPLFLSDLTSELERIEGEKVEKNRKIMLRAFQKKLASINILDPACGSGNFLTESYLSLRKLENRVIESLQGNQTSLDIDTDSLIQVSISQFYGIEINDFAVSVAKTALWIAEEQMMEATQEIIMAPFNFLPLKSNSNICESNALRMDWNEVLPAEKCTYIAGNPPFYGGMQMTREQKNEIRDVFNNLKGVGELDYVTAWYAKAAEYAKGKAVKCCFVSTNSICQGLPVGIFWRYIKEHCGFDIDYAYRTFVWNNEATDQAHVHVVIVGFSERSKATENKTIFTTDGIALKANHINGYLMPNEDIYVTEVSNPLSNVPAMRFGSMPRTKGFTLTAEQRERFIAENPLSEKWIRPYWGAEEFLNRKERYCLWLVDANSQEIERCPLVVERIDQVREERLASKAAPTRKFAKTPTLFAQIAQPEGDGDYLLVPQVSSERRDYIPIAFVSNEVIASNLAYLVPSATIYHFGVMSSQFHNAWVRMVAGRMKSDYRYAKDLVYNTFIWPEINTAQKQAIEECAQAILDVRDKHSDKKIGDIYKRDKMPSDLQAAHKALDAAVEEAYGVDFNGNEEKIVAHLFKLYAEITEGNQV